MSAQTTQLRRVRSRIGETVLAFCRMYEGLDFTASMLNDWVVDRMQAAPGSSDRILRDLRQRGDVFYTVVSRAGSIYHMDKVSA